MDTSMQDKGAPDMGAGTQVTRSGADIEATDDHLIIRLPEWLTLEQMAEIKEAVLLWFETSVAAAVSRREQGR